jgi:predicted ATP-grasp superfamily ATP-dependent carboligase
MRILVSSTRQTFGLDEVRKLGRAGHVVVAMDSLASAPGNHSRFAARSVTCPAPRFHPREFVETVASVLREEKIDLYLPIFEEVFYVAKHRDELATLADIFCPPFETLARLHDKSRCLELAASLGIATPRTRTVTSQDELREAIAEEARYLARPVFSRGASHVLTNVGPLAGVYSIERCDPTPDQPWLVQEHIDGEDICSFSVAREGRVAAHCTYIHPIELEHGTGIVSESIDGPDALAIAARIVEAVGYHGQIGFDFRRTDDRRLVLIECNPRATPGVYMMGADTFVDAVLGPVPSEPAITPAGVCRKVSLALIRQMVRERGLVRDGLHYLFSRCAKDVFAERDDFMPAIWQVLTFPQLIANRRHAGREHDRRTAVIDAYSYDVAWDGQPIP